jgi:hypothetical protein
MREPHAFDAGRMTRRRQREVVISSIRAPDSNVRKQDSKPFAALT